MSVFGPSAEEPLPVPEQPTRSLTPRAWARENLFSGPVNTVVTILFGVLLAWVAYRALWFVFVDARWEIVERNIENLLVFRYPRDELWRLWGALFVLAGGLGLAAGVGSRGSLHASPLLALRRAGPMLALVAVLLAFAGSLTATLLVVAITALAVGARLLGSRLPVRGRWAPAIALGSVLAAYLLVAHFGGVGWEDWGGLQLTLVLAVGGIVLSVPLGVLLALGRRSRLPAVRWVCVAYIELIRGVPLITILFMGAFMLGFFLPEGVETPSAVSRADRVHHLHLGVRRRDRPRRPAVGAPWADRGGAGARALDREDDAADRAAPGAAGRDPGARRAVHQPLQGHVARLHHRPDGAAGGRRGDHEAARLPRAGPARRDAPVRRLRLLVGVILDVAGEPAARAATGGG